MEEKIILTAIAGLLHDIGKLEQRARPDPWTPPQAAAQEGQPVHAAWSIDFAQHYIPAAYRPAALAGAYHHRPERSPAQDQTLSELIALADKLSAGERADLAEDEKKLPRQLLSIFERLFLPEADAAPARHYLPLKPLALERAAIFAGEAVKDDLAGAQYEALRDELRRSARQEIADPQTYLENLLAAMQRYTWSIPSAYYHSVPDVSLYDHSRMTAALAVCLASRAPDEIKTLLGAVTRQFQGKTTPADDALLTQPAALLVGGDLSGVQKFIYTLSSKRAAQTLRGRSFYLQLLTEAVLRFILAALDLPYTNVIYSGGGHFYLLAPPEAAARLPEVRRAVSQKLLALHGVSLYLALGSALVPVSGFQVGRFPQYWGDMHRSLAQTKQRRYVELDDDLYERVFEPPATGGNPEGVCSVCGADDRPVTDLKATDEAGNAQRICDLCRSFAEQIGAQLPDARFVALEFGPPANGRLTAVDVLAAFGMRFQFIRRADERIDLAGRCVVWALDDPPDDRWPQPADGRPAARLLRYTVHRTPQVEDQAEADEINRRTYGDAHPNLKAEDADELAQPRRPKLFNHISAQAVGIDRLGVLRMDVDNLGLVFQKGLGEAATLARLSTLSFQMSLFFEGWVKTLCETGDYAGLIYAVYAGGDDVFLIGPWDRMPGLAQNIRQDFAAYTGGHLAMHLSAGIAFIHGKYPVYQAANDAAEALEQAKALDGKNALSFLGRAWKWEQFAQVDEKRQRLNRLVRKTNGRTGADEEQAEGLDGPQAILQILQTLAADEADAAHRRHGRPVWGPWMWRGVYMLTRMAERSKSKHPQLAERVLEIRDALDKNNYGDINQWGTAARWAQIENRERPEKKERK